MKSTARMVFFVTAVLRVGTSIAAPLADLGAASLPQLRTTGSFALREGAQYKLGSRVGLFVDYKEMRPASGALSALETGPRAMPPVRMGGVLVLAGIRFHFN
jgi:hypothetical protein